MKNRISVSALVFVLLFLSFPIFSSGQEKSLDPILSLDRIYNSREFAPQRFGPARWMKDGSSYTTLEDSKDVQGGRDIVIYAAATGRRSILVSASKLIPSNETSPLPIDNYEWSADGKKLMIFTNSKRVWRKNTRGDYWVLEIGRASCRERV